MDLIRKTGVLCHSRHFFRFTSRTMLSENSVMHPHFRSALSRCLSSASLSTARTKETLHPALTRCVASTNLSAVSAEETAPKEELDKLYRMLEIEVRGNDPAVLKSFSWFAATAAQHLEIKVGNCWALRKANHDRMTLLKSIHIYKKHRVQYELRTYFRFMQFHQLTGSTADTFLEYIQRNLPEGVAMKATRVAVEELPQHIATTSATT